MVSYRKKHIKNKIGKIKPKKPLVKKLWFWILILVFITVFSVTYTILFYSGIQVKNVEISGNSKTNTKELQDLVMNGSGTGLLKLWDFKITSKSILFANTGKINKDILDKFPGIKNLKIEKKYPQTITVGVTERNPVGIYCGNALDNGENCFFIDEDGVAFEQVSNLPSNFTIVRQMNASSETSTGKEPVAQNVINAISQVKKDLKDTFNIDLEEALITSPVRLNVKTSENWQIYFDLASGADINSQLTKLNLLLSGEGDLKSRKNLRYIDLRPKDRAIICDNSTCGK